MVDDFVGRASKKTIMASKTNSIPYTPLPAAAANPTAPSYILLIPSSLRHPTFPHIQRRHIAFTFGVLLLCTATYIFWPSDPEIRVVRVQLNGVSVRTSPWVSLNLSLSLVARVRNRDFFSLYYDSVAVSVGYRGRELGIVKSDGEGHVKARGYSYVNATLEVNGLEVLHDLFYFVKDVAKGFVPFDTMSAVEGELGFLFFKIPIKAKVSCEVFVNPNNQTIVRQNCYPEEIGQERQLEA